MIRNYSVAAVPKPVVSDVTFCFSCLVQNHRLCLPQIMFPVSCCFCVVWTPCPVKFWFPGHFVLRGAKKERKVQHWSGIVSKAKVALLFHRFRVNIFSKFFFVCFMFCKIVCLFIVQPMTLASLNLEQKILFSKMWFHKQNASYPMIVHGEDYNLRLIPWVL